MDAEGITINALAETVGVERKNIWNWVHGRTAPRWYYIRQLENVLGCTADWLITGEEGAGNGG